MAAWHYEKRLSVLKNIAKIVDTLNEDPCQDGSIKNEIIKNLHVATHDATKLLSFSCGASWNTSDNSLILTKGSNGLEKLLVKYGVFEETKKQEKQRKNSEIIAEIFLFLNSNEPSSARTCIHEVLAKISILEKEWEPFKELTEDLTMGDISWDFYKSQAKDELRLLSSRHSP